MTIKTIKLNLLHDLVVKLTSKYPLDLPKEILIRKFLEHTYSSLTTIYKLLEKLYPTTYIEDLYLYEILYILSLYRQELEYKDFKILIFYPDLVILELS